MTRQVERAMYRAIAWAQVIKKFGGGLGWTGGHTEPRRARRKLARAIGKRMWKDMRAKRGQV